MHGVNWPHLTGPVDDVKDVWSVFAIDAREYVVDAHDDNVSDMEGQVHDSSIVYVRPDGTAEELMFLPTGMTLLPLLLTRQVGPSIRPILSTGQWSTASTVMMLQRIGVGGGASNCSTKRIRGGKTRLLASTLLTRWKKSTLHGTQRVQMLVLLEVPSGDTPSVKWVLESTQLLRATFPPLQDSTSRKVPLMAQTLMSIFKTVHGDITSTASMVSLLQAIGVGGGNFTCGMEPQTHGEGSAVGMDSIDEPMTIAWASNNTSDDAIPAPGFAVVNDSDCNGHGWVMGSGNGAHCMCDDGYEWAEDNMMQCVLVESEPEYTVGHFAYTYILDENKNPRVRYVDDSWLASDFVEDVVELAERELIIGDDSEEVPSVGLIVSVAVVSMAAISLRSKSE